VRNPATIDIYGSHLRKDGSASRRVQHWVAVIWSPAGIPHVFQGYARKSDAIDAATDFTRQWGWTIR
jgi:hypothetical protein